MITVAYRRLLGDPRTRRLLAGLGASSLGDGLSTVPIAWLAVGIAPPDQVGPFVGLAVAAYTLPGVIMFYVDDVQAEHDRAAAAGATFTMPPTKATGSTIGFRYADEFEPGLDLILAGLANPSG